MANIITLKRRITTAKNVSKTTKAMQMIAASKLKRAEAAASASRPYVEKLTALSKSISERIDENERVEYMRQDKEPQKTLVIVISPDKGLCGGLITNLIRELADFDANNKNAVYLTVGKKAEGSTARMGKEIMASFDFGTVLPLFDVVYPILKIVDDSFLSGKVSSVEILSSNYVSIFSQKPEITTLLPIKLEDSQEKLSTETLFEPRLAQLLPTILRHYLEMRLYQNFLESYLSEQAARMFAMQNATDNALEIAEDLRLEYNKSRQEKITSEILDIGSAAIFAS